MHLCPTSELLPLPFFFLSFFPFVNISKIFFIVKGNGNRFEGIWISIESVKAFICRFYLLCFFYWTLKTSHSAPPHCLQTLFKSPLECRYLTYLPVHSHSIVWIQDIPHEFLLFCIVQPPENQCFTSTDHWIFLFFFFFSYIYFFHILFMTIIPKKGIFYWHTSTSFVIGCQQACPQSWLPVCSWCFISVCLWTQNAFKSNVEKRGRTR